MDLDSLKNTWKELDRHMDRLEAESRQTARKVAEGKIASSQSRLARTYTLSAVSALLILVVVPPCSFYMHLHPAVMIGLLVYGAVMAVLHFAFAYYIRRHDFMSESVVEALGFALRVRRRRNVLLLVGLCGAFAVISAFLVNLAAIGATPAVVGGFTGLAVGIPIGVMKFRRQSQLLREMTAELEELEAV